MYKYYRMDCGKEIIKEKKGKSIIRCSDCRQKHMKEYQKQYGKKRYKVNLPVAKPLNKPQKQFCPVEHCKFRNGNNKCLFYFEYKNGTVSCPNIKELHKVLKAKEFE